MTELFFGLALLICIYLASVLIAWLINRRELIQDFGAAPFNWRIFGYTYSYIPYLKSIQREREINEQA